jgi:hypothetical protein
MQMCLEKGKSGPDVPAKTLRCLVWQLTSTGVTAHPAHVSSRGDRVPAVLSTGQEILLGRS